MNDEKGIEIRVGDLILYGYNFYCAPKVGYVTAVYKTSVRFEFLTINFHGDKVKISSVCKRPEYTIIVNPLIKDSFFRETFDLDLILDGRRVNHDELQDRNT